MHSEGFEPAVTAVKRLGIQTDALHRTATGIGHLHLVPWLKTLGAIPRLRMAELSTGTAVLCREEE
jgi:hypothetical protein